MPTHKGQFITIEGIEGAGKSTIVKFIREYLAAQKQNVIITREPGGTALAEQMRQLLLNPHSDETMVPETELLLMFAGRAQHIHKLILPALRAGKWVLSDRFVDASYAYQGGGRGLDYEKIAMLDRWIAHDCQPNLTFLLDLSPEQGFERAKHRNEKDRIEREKIEFFERVRAAYLMRAEDDPKRIRIIDASLSLSQVEAQIRTVLNEFTKQKQHAK